MKLIQEIAKQLQRAYNLILTGAPGTGKTYIAKQVACFLLFGKVKIDDLTTKETELYDNHVRFVQFHPSYDYTDFVEGIRPKIEGGFERCNGVFKDFCRIAIEGKSRNDTLPYIFIIDEINRGELSKIFGELFYSIDPGYRGPLGRTQTQYQNLVSDEDIFTKGFYIPDNVYIIGTMNDIDRNVESMDFAIRRRFAWREVLARDTMDMLQSLSPSLIKEAELRMNNLNEMIISDEINLGCAYQIGASYFLKLKKEVNNFEELWLYYIEGVIVEYLRGERDSQKKLEKLKMAYNDISLLEEMIIEIDNNIQDAKTTEQNIEDEKASVVEIDYEKELRSIDFLNYLSSKQTLNNKSSNAENHISLKFFIDYLAKKDKVLRTSKYRTDIETAVIKVFGERYSTQTYWLLYELQKKAMDIRNQYHEEGVLQDEIAEN